MHLPDQTRPERPEEPAGNSAAGGEHRRPAAWPLLVAAGITLFGVSLRIPIAGYGGPPIQVEFNAYIYRFPSAYSDVASLYFRDQLWRHPLPYFDYALEYPVGIGLLV
jgi:hypothetical protein